MHVDLRPVEGAVARVQLVLQAELVQRVGQLGLGAVPHLVVADALLRARRQLQADPQVEQLIGLEGHPQTRRDLLLHLLLGAEDVRVVLGEVAHAQQPVQHARGLVAVQQAGL